MSNTGNSDNGKYDSVEVAKYIAAYWNERGVEINMTKLQKLLYIAYGTWLAVKNERLCDEHPQAWPYGPVFQKVYDALTGIVLQDITLNDNDLKIIKKDEEVNILLKMMYKGFGKWNATKLTEWSHKDKSPWYYTCQMPDFKWGSQINNKVIQDYFISILT